MYSVLYPPFVRSQAHFPRISEHGIRSLVPSDCKVWVAIRVTKFHLTGPHTKRVVIKGHGPSIQSLYPSTRHPSLHPFPRSHPVLRGDISKLPCEKRPDSGILKIH